MDGMGMGWARAAVLMDSNFDTCSLERKPSTQLALLSQSLSLSPMTTRTPTTTEQTGLTSARGERTDGRERPRPGGGMDTRMPWPGPGPSILLSDRLRSVPVCSERKQIDIRNKLQKMDAIYGTLQNLPKWRKRIVFQERTRTRTRLNNLSLASLCFQSG